jgi:hypothetical protein
MFQNCILIIEENSAKKQLSKILYIPAPISLRMLGIEGRMNYTP